MSVLFYETPRSRKRQRDATGASITRSWYCQGLTESADVELTAFTYNPLIFEGLLRQSVSCDPISTDVWAVEVTYGVGSTSGFTPDNYSFKISAESQHITQSLQTKYRRLAGDALPAPGTAPDMKGAIGVTEDGVAGCDILVPSMQWSKSVQRAEVTHDYLRTLRRITGRVNDAEFFGYKAGSLLYLGCEPGTAQATLADGSAVTIWNLTHSFLEEPELSLEVVGDLLIPKKLGHEYVWFAYKPRVTAGDPIINRKPFAVYVEQVYRTDSFADLEIGIA